MQIAVVSSCNEGRSNRIKRSRLDTAFALVEGSADVKYITPSLSKKQRIFLDPTIDTNLLDALHHNFQQLTPPILILFSQFNNIVITFSLPLLSIIWII